MSYPEKENLFDTVDNWTVYDRVIIPNDIRTTTKINFFTEPVGNNNKTFADTNMYLSGKFPEPCWFHKKLMYGFISQAHHSDIEFINRYGYVEFWICQRLYDQQPFEEFVSESRPYYSPLVKEDGCRATDSSSILIGQDFKVELHLTQPFTPKEPISIRCNLVGRMYSGVQ